MARAAARGPSRNQKDASAIVQAADEGRWPVTPNMPAIIENLGLALAIGGFTFRVTGVSAIGVGLAIAGVWMGYFHRGSHAHGPSGNDLHPLLQKATLIVGVIGVGALGEYSYIVS